MKSKVFEISGQRVHASLEPDGWLLASISISGSPRDLLMRQAQILAPAKITVGPMIRAEMPTNKRNSEIALSAVRAALQYGIAIIGGSNESPTGETRDREAAMEILQEYLITSPWQWSRENESFVLRIETHSVRKIQVQVEPEYVRFQSDLIAGSPKPVFLDALCHFLLALNSRLRCARGSITPDGIVLEAVVPAVYLSSFLIDKAVSSLIAGARTAKQECALLLDEDFAQKYLEFQKERR